MEEELLQIARELVRRYFVLQDYTWVTEHLCTDACWLGLSSQDAFFGGRQIARHLALETQTPPPALTLSDEQCCAVAVSSQAGAVAGTACACFPEAKPLVLRFTAAFRKQDEQWRVAGFHYSVPGASVLPAGLYDWEQDRMLDPLTGILNMEGFVRRAAALLRTQPPRRYALIKINIIRFRYINQTYGYATGDEVLCSIAKNLQACCCPGELCARPEKDNFALLCLYPGSKSALDDRLQALRPVLVAPETAARLHGALSFNAGVYLPPPGGKGENVKDMLDKAMIAARSLPAAERANQYAYFQPEMWREKLQEGRLLEELPEAMANGEFQLYIQPQVSLQSLRVTAGEALVRWVKPDGAMIMPDQFIPLFEDNGAILKFDFHMLDLLCRQMRKWMDEGIALTPISINQSRRHIHDPDYLERFCAAVDRYGIPHSHIAFELTESAFVEDSDQMACLAHALHEQGFLLNIDDFGTGYASLNMLGTITADILKIDRSLISDYETNPRSGIILRKVVEMAHETHMTVVCEGVETVEQCAFLQQLGCDVAQGFYFYRPMPADQFERQVLRGKPARTSNAVPSAKQAKRRK